MKISPSEAGVNTFVISMPQCRLGITAPGFSVFTFRGDFKRGFFGTRYNRKSITSSGGRPELRRSSRSMRTGKSGKQALFSRFRQKRSRSKPRTDCPSCCFQCSVYIGRGCGFHPVFSARFRIAVPCVKPCCTIPIHFIENRQQEQENHGQKCPQTTPSVFLPVQDAITSPFPIITIQESSDQVIPSAGSILPIRENANRTHFHALSIVLSAIKTNTVVPSDCNAHPIQLICISQDG